MDSALPSLPKGGLAIVRGLCAIGSALPNRLQEGDGFCRVIGFSRAALDLTDEATITNAARNIAQHGAPPRSHELSLTRRGSCSDRRLSS